MCLQCTKHTASRLVIETVLLLTVPEGYKPFTSTAPDNPELWMQFQTVIGSLLYLMLDTCPDIAYCYDSLLGLHSFPHLILPCHISFPSVPFLCLSSLSSYPGTPHVHCTHPLTPTPFLALLPDRGYPLLITS